VVATRAATLVHEELMPLLAQAQVLPLPPQRLQRSAALLPVLPLLPAHAVMLVALQGAAVRAPVLAAFVLASLGAAAVQAHWPPAKAENQAGRWLLLLALLIALASEVLR
jgi:hypothetical protein